MQFKKINDHYSVTFKSKLYSEFDTRKKSSSNKENDKEIVKSKIKDLINLANYLKNQESKYEIVNHNLVSMENELKIRRAILNEKEEKYRKDYEDFIGSQDKQDYLYSLFKNRENSEDIAVLSMINEIKQQLSEKLNSLMIEEEEAAEEERNFHKRLDSLTIEEKESFLKCERDYYSSYITKEVFSKGKNSEVDNTSEHINLSVMKLPKTEKEEPDLLEELSVEINNLEKKVTKLGGYQNMVRKQVRKNYHEESTRPSYTKKPSNKGNSSVGFPNKSCEEISSFQAMKNDKKKSSTQTTVSNKKNKYSFNYIKKYDLVDFSLSISDFLPKRNKQRSTGESFRSGVRNLQNISQTIDENQQIEFKSKIFSSKSSAEMIILRTAKD